MIGNAEKETAAVEEKIVLCKRCRNPEYWGEMRWLSGACICRDCYKKQYEEDYGKPYAWDDLDGPRPTVDDYIAQEEP